MRHPLAYRSARGEMSTVLASNRALEQCIGIASQDTRVPQDVDPTHSASPALLPKSRSLLATLGIHLAVWITMLGVLELGLRIIDFRVLRDSNSERMASYRHDEELGWVPLPHSSAIVTTERRFHVQHNSLGLRDIEPEASAKPKIMFIGDSFVWGNDVEANERFTERLREALPEYAIVNAGVSGYGTDQELLLLRRLWSRINPAVVVLMFTVVNDRWDNISSVRYDGYFKPYFAPGPNGTLTLSGQPVPRPRQLYFKENPLVRNLWIGRAAMFAYTTLRYPIVTVPDPTEQLVGMMRDLATSRGARFLVGMQITEPKLAGYLTEQAIPFIAFDGAEMYPTIEFGFHWTPEGHAFVAKRLLTLFARTGLIAGASGN